MAGIGNAPRFGIIIRLGDAIERFSKINHIAFDKTSTLTLGKMEVIAVHSIDTAISENKLMMYTAAVEKYSEHPIGNSIITYCLSNNINIIEPKEFTLLAGQGVRAEVDDLDIIIGKADLLKSFDIQIPKQVNASLNSYLSQGATIIFVAINCIATGFVVSSDTMREDAPKWFPGLRNSMLNQFFLLDIMLLQLLILGIWLVLLI